MSLEFKECASCAAKPGSPLLCPTCLHNRATVAKLHDRVKEAEKDRDTARKFYDNMAERVALLEDGGCRFNCRSRRAMFIIGYNEAISNQEFGGDFALDAEDAYNEWNKEND